MTGMIPGPGGLLSVVPDELLQAAGLMPIDTIGPVPAQVQATPPVAGAMPGSQITDAHLTYSVEQTANLTLSAVSGIQALISGLLGAAGQYAGTDLMNETSIKNAGSELPAVTGNSSSRA